MVTTRRTPAIHRHRRHSSTVSLDERLVDYSTGVDLDGYVWGVKWHALYPGSILTAVSPTADRWAQQLGVPFPEVRIETNAHAVTLVFSDLQISDVPVGYVPFLVTDKAKDTPLRRTR